MLSVIRTIVNWIMFVWHLTLKMLGNIYNAFAAMCNKHAPNACFTDELALMIREKNASWVRARATTSAADCSAFRALRNKCTKMTKKSKSDYYLKTLSEIFNNPFKFRKSLSCSNPFLVFLNIFLQTLSLSLKQILIALTQALWPWAASLEASFVFTHFKRFKKVPRIRQPRALPIRRLQLKLLSRLKHTSFFCSL